MQLPPERQNEPEWLVVQRANKTADRQFALAFAPMQAALGASLIPLAFIPPEVGFASRVALAIVYGVLVVAFCTKVVRPRTSARTVGRYVVNYVGIAWGVFVAISLFGSAISLLAALRG